MLNTVLNHVKDKPILNIQLRSVKSAKKNINLYERQVNSVLLDVVLQIRKIELFLSLFSYRTIYGVSYYNEISRTIRNVQ